MWDLTGDCHDDVLDVMERRLAENRRAPRPSEAEGYMGQKGNTLAQFSPLAWSFLG